MLGAEAERAAEALRELDSPLGHQQPSTDAADRGGGGVTRVILVIPEAAFGDGVWAEEKEEEAVAAAAKGIRSSSSRRCWQLMPVA